MNSYRSATREYFFRKSASGLVSVHYQVINAKTGAAWQGIKQDKNLSYTHHCFSKGNLWTAVTEGAPARNESGAVIHPFSDNSLSWLDVGFISYEAALNAVKALNK